MENYDRYGIAFIITFGALIVGGLMAAGLFTADRAVFLTALSAGIAAWFAGYAMIFNQPRAYGLLALVAIALIGWSIAAYVT